MKKYVVVFGMVFLAACTHHSKLNLPSSTIDELSLHLIDSLIDQSKAEFSQNHQITDYFDYYLREAIAIANQHKQFAKQAEIYNEVAKRYRNVSAFAKAINYYQKSLDIANAIQNDRVKAYTTHEMAVAFRRIDNNANALKLHIQVLEWAEMAKDTFLIHSSLNGIGNVYLSYNNTLEAITYFHRSLHYLGSNPRNLLGEAINTNNIGEGWLTLHRPDSASIYLQKSFDINKLIDSKIGQAICHNGFGNVEVYNKEFKNAIHHYEASLEINRKIGDLIYVADNLRNLGTTYLAMNNTYLAEKYLKQAVEISEEIGSKAQVFESTKALGRLYAMENKPGLALKYIEKSLAYKDSITLEISEQNTEAMNVLYKAEKQTREILILKQQAELKELKRLRERWILISFLIFLLLGLSFLLIILRQRRLKNRFKELELEQKLFRSQLNPHFLFNSLTAVQNFILNNDKLVAFDYLANFSRLMRTILMGSKNELTTLDKEVELLQDYIRLQHLRFHGKFEYQIHVAEDLWAETCYIPSMLVQPFVENAIEHGVQGLDYCGKIDIRFYRQGTFLAIEVEDNGCGLKNDSSLKKSEHVSMAIQITQQRLETIKHQTKQNCKLDIINKNIKKGGSGVLVQITIPYLEDNY